MNRRSFLQQSLATSGVIVLAPLRVPLSAGVVITQHGADPTGRRDSAAAIRAAIALLPKEGGRLIFPKGTYRLDQTTGSVLAFNSLHGLTVEGNGSLLLCRDQGQPLCFTHCTDTTLTDLQIDWQIPPFSQGRVQSVDGNQVTIKLDAEFANASIDKVEAIGQYDPATRLPSPNGIDSYHSVASAQTVSPGMIRLTLKQPLPLAAGMYLVLRHTVYGANAVILRSCEQTRVSVLTIRTAPGLGLLALGCTNLALQGFSVTPTPGTGRFLSTCSDGSHFADCRGSLSFSQCRFQGMGDDAINAFATFWKVESSQPGSVTVSARSDSPIGAWQLPRAGDMLQFVDARTVAPLGHATAANTALRGNRADLSFTGGAASIPQGTLVCNLSSAPQLAVAQSQFLGNRARGIVAHADVTIDNNSFSGCSMAAILLAPDAHWMEGPAVEKVAIRNNRFANCGYARANGRLGVITIDTNHDQRPDAANAPQVNRNIEISGNIFDPSPAPDIYCAHASAVTLFKNTFAPRSQASASSATARTLAAPAAAEADAAQVVIVDSDILHLKENTGASEGGIVLSQCTGVDAAANLRLTLKRSQ